MGRGSPVMAFRGKSTHTPVSNPSPMICKETQQTHWFPKVNNGRIMSQFVAGTLGKGMDVVYVSSCVGGTKVLAPKELRNQEC